VREKFKHYDPSLTKAKNYSYTSANWSSNLLRERVLIGASRPCFQTMPHEGDHYYHKRDLGRTSDAIGAHTKSSVSESTCCVTESTPCVPCFQTMPHEGDHYYHKRDLGRTSDAIGSHTKSSGAAHTLERAHNKTLTVGSNVFDGVKALSLQAEPETNRSPAAIMAAKVVAQVCGLGVCYMFTHCSLIVHSLFTHCSLVVHPLCTHCSSVFTQCYLLFTQCSRSVHTMFTQRSLNVYSMFTQCSLNVHAMLTQRSLNVPQC
jgi:hypothetical protein